MGQNMNDGRIKDGKIVVCYVCANSTWTTGYSKALMTKWLREKKGWIYVKARRRWVCGANCEAAIS